MRGLNGASLEGPFDAVVVHHGPRRKDRSMAEKTEIAWTDSTFNPWWGCSKVGPGCDHCYAEALDKRTGGDHWGATKTPRDERGQLAQAGAVAADCRSHGNAPSGVLRLDVRLGRQERTGQRTRQAVGIDPGDADARLATAHEARAEHCAMPAGGLGRGL